MKLKLVCSSLVSYFVEIQKNNQRSLSKNDWLKNEKEAMKEDKYWEQTAMRWWLLYNLVIDVNGGGHEYQVRQKQKEKLQQPDEVGFDIGGYIDDEINGYDFLNKNTKSVRNLTVSFLIPPSHSLPPPISVV